MYYIIKCCEMYTIVQHLNATYFITDNNFFS